MLEKTGVFPTGMNGVMFYRIPGVVVTVKGTVVCMGIDPPAIPGMVADYYNCMSWLDTLVGDLLAVLHRSGKAYSTPRGHA